MIQEFLVGLDVHDNKIINLGPGIDPGDAVNVSQLAGLVSLPTDPAPPSGSSIYWDGTQWVTDTRTITVGPGLEGGGALTSDVAIWVNYGDAIVSGANGISINPGSGLQINSAADTVEVKAGRGIVAAADGVHVDTGAALDITPDGVAVKYGSGLYLEIGPADITGADTIAVQSGNGIVVDGGGVSIDPSFTAGIQASIDALDITGSGMAVVTETAPNSGVWNVHVEAIDLANTYVGAGTDSDSINGDLAGRIPPVTAGPGDIYVNDSTGDVFINTGQPAPNDWTALEPAVGLSSIASADGSIVVNNGGGPTATVRVNIAPQGGISGDEGGLYVDAGEGLERTATGVAVKHGTGLTVELAGDAVADTLAVDKTTLDSWYPALPPGPYNPGDSITWDGSTWVVGPPTPTAVGFKADVALVAGTQVPVVHNLNTDSVTVSMRNMAGCFVEASICVTDANTIAIGTTVSGTYRVVVTGVL